MHHLGRTLAIVNPAAQNGNGARAAAFLKYASAVGEAPFLEFDIRTTNASGHAVDLAASSVAYDTVLAVGGDGVIHEVVQGLMKIPRTQRPALGVLPRKRERLRAHAWHEAVGLRGVFPAPHRRQACG